MMHKLASALVLDCDLSEVRLLLERYSGVLLDAPSELLRESIAQYAESLNLATAADLVALLRSSPAQCDGLLEILLADESGFLRCPALFEALAKRVLPQIELRKSGDNPRALRIWSAGCSTGEEPYSIAISVCEALQGSASGWNISIIASDIRNNALAAAERGVYAKTAVKGLPHHWLTTYFARLGNHFLVKPRLRNLVVFTPMNLAQANFIGRFDCIVCVDVLSRFSASQRSVLLQRLHMFLEPGGYLLLGEKEKISTHSSFQSETYAKYTYYRRPIAAAAHSGR
jgi:chemotaxis methyl-accepting protein methylase